MRDLKREQLGDRLKKNFENRYRYYLPRRTYTIIRCDGKAFHSFCKKAEKPFDSVLIEAMAQTATFLCSKIEGAKLGYVQSDEITVLMTDFDTTNTQSWFDGNQMKIVSVSAALSTAMFNRLMALSNCDRFDDLAVFDARVFCVPDPAEVANNFLWRCRDWERNSVNMLARKYHSHKELHGKSMAQMHEMIFQKGDNWANYPDNIKNGTLIVKDPEEGWVARGAPKMDYQAFRDLVPNYPS